MKSSSTKIRGWIIQNSYGQLRILLVAIMIVIMSISATAQTVVEKYGRLQKFGSHICAEDGEQISLAGNSYFWSNWGGTYYNSNSVDFLVDEMETSIVRAAMGISTHETPVPGGYLQDQSGQKAIVEAVIQQAIARGIYVIIDWHVEGDTRDWKTEAQAFFSEMAQKYGHEPNIIYEIWNEPTQNNWHTDIRPYAVDVINSIRQHDPDNLIIVGTETWSQRPDDASTNQINDPNIAYTIHFYPDDPGIGEFHRQQLRDNVITAMNNGAAVFATEWGPSEAAPNPESDIWMQFLQDNRISHCMWSVNDKIADGDWQWSIFEPGTPGTGPYTLRGPGFYLQDLMINWPWKGGDPISCTAVNIPGRLEAEDWCAQSGVQTENTSDSGSGLNVGWIDSGDWMEYLINVQNNGAYQVDFRVAAAGTASKSFNVLLDGSVLETVTFNGTGGWQNWITESASINLTQGEHTLRIEAQTDGFNMNYLDFSNGCNDPTLSSITITPGNLTLEIGQTIDFDVAGIDGCGNPVNVNPNWSGADANGVFTASSVGNFQVSASVSGLTDQVTVTVVDNSTNMLSNGNFINGDSDWSSYINSAADAALSVTNGEFNGSVSNGGTANWHVQWYQGGITIEQGHSYSLTFEARSNSNRSIEVNVEKNGDPWTSYNSESFGLSNQMESYGYTFTMNDVSDINSRVLFNLGGASGNVIIDNVALIDNGGSIPSWSQLIQAEDFSAMDGVQTQTTSDAGGGLNVGWLDNSDWMSFHDIDIPSSGSYTVSYRVASNGSGGELQLEKAGGGTIYGTITVPGTGGWQNWTTISHNVFLDAGIQDIAISIPQGGWNLNWFEISSITNGKVDDEYINETQNVISVYPIPARNSLNIQGVSDGVRSFRIVSMEGKTLIRSDIKDSSNLKIDISDIQTGVYLLQLVGDDIQTIRFVKI